MLTWLQVFFGLVVIDVLYAIYTKQVQKDNAILASLSAAVLYIISGLVVVGFVKDIWLLVPAGLGAFVGTYIGVKINDKL
jgi:uncharacterized membrane protein YfcA